MLLLLPHEHNNPPRLHRHRPRQPSLLALLLQEAKEEVKGYMQIYGPTALVPYQVLPIPLSDTDSEYAWAYHQFFLT